SLVSAEPPNIRRSMSAITWRSTPASAATRFAASSSTLWRWPYRNDSALAWYPSDLAIASTVVESRPPLRRTTAFLSCMLAGLRRGVARIGRVALTRDRKAHLAAVCDEGSHRFRFEQRAPADLHACQFAAAH